MSPLDASRAREAALAAGLHKLAAACGITLQGACLINSNGEIPILAVDTSPTTWPGSCGRYGPAFAAILSKYAWRTGIRPVRPGMQMLPENGWCYMNHFEVERMLAAELKA